MIRTVWLATICLAVLGALALGKALVTHADLTVTAQPADQATVGTSLPQDTLGKADRLEITRVNLELPAPSASQPTTLAAPVRSAPRPVENKIVSRHWHDPNAISSSATKSKQIKQAASDTKSKSVDRKSKQAADRPKACSRPGAVGNLLRSLNLSPACDS
jgi:hypothetical protein